MDSTGAGRRADPPCVESVITGGRHPRRPDSMETSKAGPVGTYLEVWGGGAQDFTFWGELKDFGGGE